MISAKEWRAYNEAVEKIASGASSAVESGVLKWCDEHPGASAAEAREAAKAIMGEYAQGYDELASAFAAEWYDAQAGAAGARLQQAVTCAVYRPESADEVARYQVRKLIQGGEAEFARACGEFARNDALRSLNETIIANAGRDKKKGVRFARVPTGWETCTFCLMLAGRGAVYHTRKSAGEFRHFHRRCDCKVVPGFESDPDAELVEGFSPAASRELLRKLEEIDSMKEGDGGNSARFDLEVMKAAWANPEIDYGKVASAMAEYSIPAAKLEEYSLNMEKQPDKARAFRDCLGYVQDDAATVAAKLYEFVSEKEPEPRPPDKWGDRFSTRMVMGGKAGKFAKVKAGWIRESGAAKMRAVSVYVAK